MMWGRFPAALAALGATTLVGSPWPFAVALALWYAIWLVWVAGVFEN